jgi:flagellar motor switch protein FliN/FliY
MTEAPPLHWIKEIQSTLIDAKQIPMHGFAPAFPWEEFSEKAASSLQMDELRIAPKSTQILTGNEITNGLGANFITIALEMMPLHGQIFWLMGKEDMVKFSTVALNPSNGKGFSSPKFQEGFYYFLATQALQALNALKPFGDLAPRLGKTVSLPSEESLCIDVEVTHPKQTFWGRFVCPASFHRDFKTHFSTQEPVPLSSEVAKQIDVTLSLEVGHTLLSLAQWNGISVGDFVLLDRCTFDPNAHKGTGMLMLEQIPLLRARIKENSLKIVDYASYNEEQIPMNDKTPEEENENPEETFNPEESVSPEENSEEEHLWSPPSTEQVSEKMIPANDVPLTVTVEVTRLRINLDKLMQLTPGNVLELPVKPEQGVDLTINGKKVAKAELIKIGEALGVKILEIGK